MLAEKSDRFQPLPAGRRGAALRLGQGGLAWLGVSPFFVFALLFLVLPTLFLAVGAFQDQAGRFTLDNILNLAQPAVVKAYWLSFKISAASALLGALAGFCLAIALTLGRLPGWIRPTVMTF